MSPIVRRLLAGELLAWLDLEVQLLLWGDRPAWADDAGMHTVIALAPRFGWPRAASSWCDVTSYRGSAPRRLGQAARLRWHHETELARLEEAEPWRLVQFWPWPVLRDEVPMIVGYTADNREVLLWGEHVRATLQIIPVSRRVLTPDERQALDIVAAVLGAPA